MYTSSLSAELVEQTVTTYISSWDDLTAKEVKVCVKSGAAYSSILDQSTNMDLLYVTPSSTEGIQPMLDAMRKGDCEAYVDARAHVEYAANTYPWCLGGGDKGYGTLIHKYGDGWLQGPQNFAIGVRKDLVGVDFALSQHILGMQSDGTMEALIDGWGLGSERDVRCSDSNRLDEDPIFNEGTSGLGLENMLGLTIAVVGVGLVSIFHKTYTCWRDVKESYKPTTLSDFIHEFMVKLDPTFKIITNENEFRILSEWDKEAAFKRAIFLPVFVHLRHRDFAKAKEWKKNQAVIEFTDESLQKIEEQRRKLVLATGDSEIENLPRRSISIVDMREAPISKHNSFFNRRSKEKKPTSVRGAYGFFTTNSATDIDALFDEFSEQFDADQDASQKITVDAAEKVYERRKYIKKNLQLLMMTLIAPNFYICALYMLNNFHSTNQEREILHEVLSDLINSTFFDKESDTIVNVKWHAMIQKQQRKLTKRFKQFDAENLVSTSTRQKLFEQESTTDEDSPEQQKLAKQFKAIERRVARLLFHARKSHSHTSERFRLDLIEVRDQLAAEFAELPEEGPQLQQQIIDSMAFLDRAGDKADAHVRLMFEDVFDVYSSMRDDFAKALENAVHFLFAVPWRDEKKMIGGQWIRKNENLRTVLCERRVRCVREWRLFLAAIQRASSVLVLNSDIECSIGRPLLSQPSGRDASRNLVHFQNEDNKPDFRFTMSDVAWSLTLVDTYLSGQDVCLDSMALKSTIIAEKYQRYIAAVAEDQEYLSKNPASSEDFALNESRALPQIRIGSSKQAHTESAL